MYVRMYVRFACITIYVCLIVCMFVCGYVCIMFVCMHNEIYHHKCMCKKEKYAKDVTI